MSVESKPSARVIGAARPVASVSSPSLGSSLLPALIVLLLFGRLIGFVMTNVVNMPFMDEWYVWSDLLDGLDSHTSLTTLLAAPYNGHRLVVVRTMLVALLPTGWSIYPQVSVTLAVSALWLGTLWFMYRRTAAALGVATTRWTLVALAGLVLACNDINRLWGMGVEWHVLVLAWTLCLLLLSAAPFRWSRLILAGGAAALASFSVAPGLLVWLIGIPVLWVTLAGSSNRRPATVTWAAAAAAFWLLYLRKLPELAGQSSIMTGLSRPLALGIFVLEYLGMPLAPLYNLNLFVALGAIGIVLLITGVLWVWRSERQMLVPFTPWLGLAALSVGAAAMAYVARAPSHVPPYYITIGRTFWIAALGPTCLLAAVLSRRESAFTSAVRWSGPAIAILVLLVEFPQYGFAVASWSAPREALLQAAYDVPDVCAGNWEVSSRITAPADALRSRYATLARHRLAFIQGQDFGTTAVAGGNGQNRLAGQVERAVVEPPAPDKGPACVRLSGWTDVPNGDSAREVVLVQGNTILKRSGVRRADANISSAEDTRSHSPWTMYVSRMRWPADPSSLKLFAIGMKSGAAYALGGVPPARFPAGDLSRYEMAYALGTELFASEATDGCVLDGFSGSEAGGRWTDGEEAQLTFTLSNPAASALTLSLTADAFLAPQHPQQRVEVLVNGHTIERWTFQPNPPSRDRQVLIPASIVAGQTRVVVTFRLPDAMAPARLNLSADPRLLGLRLVRFRLTATP